MQTKSAAARAKSGEPLAADPGSDVLHDHVDMLLLDKEGAFQTVTWWNALTQCPAYQPTIDFYVELVKTKDAGGKAGPVMWNFEKFLVSGSGEILGRFSPMITPEDPALVAAIESHLK